MSLKEEVFGWFIGTLYLVTYLVNVLGTSKGDYIGTCSNGSNVTSWSGWTCNIENSTATRTGNCKDDGHVNELETVKVTVYSWTSWSPWLPTCGVVEMHRSHSCVVPSPDSLYCSTCGCENTTVKESKPSNLPPCCEDYPFGTWSSWRPPCSPDDIGGKYINQSRTRERSCSDSSNCTLCPLEMQTRRVILQSWSKWGEWSGTLRPCAEKTYRRRSRSCPAPANPQDYPVYSCCNSTSNDVEYSCCGSVYTLRNISCGSEYCVWECYNKTSPISPNAPSPLIKDPYVCLEDPPQCSELGRTWNVSSMSTSLYSGSPDSTVSPKSTVSPEPVPSKSTECPSSSLPYTLPSTTSTPPSATCIPPSANDTSVPVYIWAIIGVSGVGGTVLMIIGATSLLICCYVKKFRHRDDGRRTPLLCTEEYQDQSGEIVLFDGRDHPQVDEDTTGGEFVTELPYKGFLTEEKRNTSGGEYKNIRTTSEKRPSTERRPHPKLFNSVEDDDEVFTV